VVEDKPPRVNPVPVDVGWVTFKPVLVVACVPNAPKVNFTYNDNAQNMSNRWAGEMLDFLLFLKANKEMFEQILM
jgi:hypothetical protein